MHSFIFCSLSLSGSWRGGAINPSSHQARVDHSPVRLRTTSRQLDNCTRYICSHHTWQIYCTYYPAVMHLTCSIHTEGNIESISKAPFSTCKCLMPVANIWLEILNRCLCVFLCVSTLNAAVSFHYILTVNTLKQKIRIDRATKIFGPWQSH